MHQILREKIEAQYLADESELLTLLTHQADLGANARVNICNEAAILVERIRNTKTPNLMDVFLAEYGLSTNEGVALMCLAEALLRVPDADTIDELIEDKIAPSDWGKHLGQSTSPLVNASTWALLLTGKVLSPTEPGPVSHLRQAIKRLGEPIIRAAVSRAMREMGHQFVLGENIENAMQRAAAMEDIGYFYSFDMLGEAARTEADACNYYLAYSRAIGALAPNLGSYDPYQNSGISVKLSALHPRYEVLQRQRVMQELLPRARSLAITARSAGLGFTIDAEEADRLSISLDVIEALAGDPALSHWDGLGVVVQAYGQRANSVIDWLHQLAVRTNRRLMVRLVKGAYWDSEIKRAQELGLASFPVFTTKAATDISYLACVRKLLSMTDRIYPQFATHNAHTVQAILHMSREMQVNTCEFEFQRLHGMGESLHALVKQDNNTRCRIYAPVGAHKDLLAYLVRRLLENGANSSFVNQVVDRNVAAEVVAADPFEAPASGFALPTGAELFAPARQNSKGWEVTDMTTLAAINQQRDQFRYKAWTSNARTVGTGLADRKQRQIYSPAHTTTLVGSVQDATAQMAAAAIDNAQAWRASVADRADTLRKIADAYEANHGELFALLHREAGKTLLDAVGELREAVDFLRYYAAQLEHNEINQGGCWVCISPWNFPLAIFTGQVAAALATGNSVLAKPAQQTCLIASRAVQIMHSAGVPETALQLLPGGAEIGAELTRSAMINGVAFTGSTVTAQKIRLAMATHAAPGTPLIAETGGLNAMVVDSTALPEMAVRDILQSAFQSAGQRCSALRCLYVQQDVAQTILTMLQGAMDELKLGDPWLLCTDVGPVIDQAAQRQISEHINEARAQGRLLHQLETPQEGNFIAPTLIQVDGIRDIGREVFGPVLHVATFKADELNTVLSEINEEGYGLTFGLHSRIDDRVQSVVETINVGNCYVNRNQIGAIVGCQPFGGEGLSGTGPKAGGPHYLPRFAFNERITLHDTWPTRADAQALADALNREPSPTTIRTQTMPGPTGESNQLSLLPRGPVLCLGPGETAAKAQATAVNALGGVAVQANGYVAPESLTRLNLACAVWWGDKDTGRAYELALAARRGPIISLICGQPDAAHVLRERLVSIDTTAAGGNPELLVAAARTH